jgi:ADP-L-glycero-D-manno-heptose 6-epimerase
MIIVTGSSGFIGKNLISLIDDQAANAGLHGSPVYTCDYVDNSRGFPADIHPNDLIKFLERWEGRIAAVIHLGAISDTTAPASDELLTNNVDFTMDLYEACKRLQIRFMYASSAATYGGGEHGHFDDDALEHLAKLNPLNPYARTKAMVDHRIFESIDNGGGKPPQLVGLKFFNVYGPHEEHKGHMRSIMLKMHDQILTFGEEENPHIHLFKSYEDEFDHGEQRRDFVHVDDCCKVIYWLLENEDVNGLFNVGTGQAESFNCVASHVFHNMGYENYFGVKYIEMPEDIQEQYQYDTQASVTKLRGAGYKEPFLSIGEGVKKYINFLTKDAEGSNYNTKEV